MTDPHVNGVGVHLVIEDANRVLLGRRLNSSFAEGWYHVPAGRLEAADHESITGCAVREAYEEAGIGIDPADLELVHVVHMHDTGDGRDRVQVFLRVLAYTGTITRAEPDKCQGWEWHHYDSLPAQLVDYTRTALAGIRTGRLLSEVGFPQAAESPALEEAECR